MYTSNTLKLIAFTLILTGVLMALSNIFDWLTRIPSIPSIPTFNEEMVNIYKNKILPLEEKYYFHQFNNPKLEDGYFDAKPTIVFIGQYSTGKTTLINYLLGGVYQRTETEIPTTDRFHVLTHNKIANIMPCNVLISDPRHKLRPLRNFGNGLLNRLQCSQFNATLLETITLIDTPGILSGEQKRIDRGYDIIGVFESLSEIADLVILLFDAHKLDISDEFKSIIKALLRYDYKISIVLNKADTINPNEWTRLYEALMWSLSRIIPNPETLRVYSGSFFEASKPHKFNGELFSSEEQKLLSDIKSLPSNAAVRRLDQLIRRSQLAKVHAFIIGELYNGMPYLFYKEYTKNELIKNLDKIYHKIATEHGFPADYFPNIKDMREKLKRWDFNKFIALNSELIYNVDDMITFDVPKLMALIQKEQYIRQENAEEIKNTEL